MITIKDIAERAGVSYATVSRALNGRHDVNETTRSHILELARELGYQPNAIARSLVRRKSHIIAVIVPDVSNPFFADITMAVNEAADQAGYTTMICNTGWDPVKEQEKLRIMVGQRVDGIILKPVTTICSEAIEALGVPVVVFWHAAPDQLSYVEVDHAAGSRLAVNHLIDRGYRRIAYVGGYLSSPSNQIRLETYRQTLEKRQLPVDPSLISYGPFRQDSGYERFGALLDRPDPPDAVFCGNDFIAIGILQLARERGLKVPEQLAIIGFDDIATAALPLVSLTTVAQPRDRLGQAALQALLREIELFPRHACQRIIIAPRLKIRSTT
jgi:LacI family transcriptional regulator